MMYSNTQRLYGWEKTVPDTVAVQEQTDTSAVQEQTDTVAMQEQTDTVAMQEQTKRFDRFLFLLFSAFYFLYAMYYLCAADKKALPLLLPGVFFYFFVIVYGQIHKYVNYTGCGIFFMVCLLRYFLIPYTQMSEGDILNSYFFRSGLKFFIAEAFVICLFFGIILRHYYSRMLQQNRYTDSFKICWNDVSPGWVYGTLLLIAAIVIQVNPVVLQDYHFILQVEESDMIHAEYQGIGMIFVELGRTILTAMLAGLFAFLYSKTNAWLFFFLSVCTVILLCTGILFGYSRYSILMPSVAGVYLLMRLFPRKKKLILSCVCVALVGSISLATLLKNTQYEAELDTFYYDMYFSGPHNIGGAVVASQQFRDHIGEETIANDLFYNVPFWGHFFEPDNRTTTFFNITMGMHVNVVSTIGQTKMLFGNLFCMIPELIYLLLLAQFDNWIMKARRVYHVFSLMFINCHIGFCFFQNMSIMTGFLFGSALFYALLMLFDRWASSIFQTPKRICPEEVISMKRFIYR